MSGWMIFEPDQQDFRPEILVQRVLRFDDGEIITGGNYAAIQDDEIIFAGRQKHSLATAGQREEQKQGSSGGEEFVVENFFHKQATAGTAVFE